MEPVDPVQGGAPNIRGLEVLVISWVTSGALMICFMITFNIISMVVDTL